MSNRRRTSSSFVPERSFPTFPSSPSASLPALRLPDPASPSTSASASRSRLSVASSLSASSASRPFALDADRLGYSDLFDSGLRHLAVAVPRDPGSAEERTDDHSASPRTFNAKFKRFSRSSRTSSTNTTKATAGVAEMSTILGRGKRSPSVKSGGTTAARSLAPGAQAEGHGQHGGSFLSWMSGGRSSGNSGSSQHTAGANGVANRRLGSANTSLSSGGKAKEVGRTLKGMFTGGMVGSGVASSRKRATSTASRATASSSSASYLSSRPPSYGTPSPLERERERDRPSLQSHNRGASNSSVDDPFFSPFGAGVYTSSPTSASFNSAARSYSSSAGNGSLPPPSATSSRFPATVADRSSMTSGYTMGAANAPRRHEVSPFAPVPSSRSRSGSTGAGAAPALVNHPFSASASPARGRAGSASSQHGVEIGGSYGYGRARAGSASTVGTDDRGSLYSGPRPAASALSRAAPSAGSGPRTRTESAAEPFYDHRGRKTSRPGAGYPNSTWAASPAPPPRGSQSTPTGIRPRQSYMAPSAPLPPAPKSLTTSSRMHNARPLDGAAPAAAASLRAAADRKLDRSTTISSVASSGYRRDQRHQALSRLEGRTAPPIPEEPAGRGRQASASEARDTVTRRTSSQGPRISAPFLELDDEDEELAYSGVASPSASTAYYDAVSAISAASLYTAPPHAATPRVNHPLPVFPTALQSPPAIASFNRKGLAAGRATGHSPVDVTESPIDIALTMPHQLRSPSPPARPRARQAVGLGMSVAHRASGASSRSEALDHSQLSSFPQPPPSAANPASAAGRAGLYGYAGYGSGYGHASATKVAAARQQHQYQQHVAQPIIRVAPAPKAAPQRRGGYGRPRPTSSDFLSMFGSDEDE